MPKDSRPKFQVRLEKGNYDDELAVFNLVTQFKKISWDFAQFQQKLHKEMIRKEPVLQWDFCTPEQCASLDILFKAIGVNLSIAEVNSTFLFPIEYLTNYENDWFSPDLVHLAETALDEWAIANGVTEVYRVTEIPSFDPTITVRISEDNVTRKSGSVYWGKKTYYENWVPTKTTWNKILQIMDDEEFWESTSWNTVQEGWLVLDGTVYIIEGYRNGQYNFLYDEGAAEDSAGYVAGEFAKLRSNEP